LVRRIVINEKAQPNADLAPAAAEPKAASNPPPTEAARRFAIEAARMAANTRCTNVVVLDVSHVSPVTDFFVIATGTSPRQMRSAGEDIEEIGEPMGYKAFARSGFEGESWILVDFVDVIVHVFSQDARLYYDLDNLWGDAKKVEWEAEKH
jgi:ribosome-associated protein